MTPDAPHFVANAIQDRLPKIGLHRADVSGLEGIELPQHVEHRFLHQIAGIELPFAPRPEACRVPIVSSCGTLRCRRASTAGGRRSRARTTSSIVGSSLSRVIAAFGRRAGRRDWALVVCGTRCNDSGEPRAILSTERRPWPTKYASRVSPVYPASTPQMLGSTVSHYRITGKLGTGGMGVVYEAEDTRLPRKVALKFLPDELADDPDAVRRFRREADTIATLSHGHICTIYDIDEHDGQVFIAMECVDGVNLKTYIAPHAHDAADRGHRPADCRRTRGSPRQGHRPPRHQAGQPDRDGIGRP